MPGETPSHATHSRAPVLRTRRDSDRARSHAVTHAHTPHGHSAHIELVRDEDFPSEPQHGSLASEIGKRALDLLGSTVLLILLAPVLLLVALVIRLDSPGPALFAHRRLGRNGRHFDCLKFRTMAVDAEHRVFQDEQLRHHYVSNHFKIPTELDPRITRVGRFLRQSSLDELPQLWNVLHGDMSLVGPRPEWVALVPEFSEKVPLYLHRLAAKPGITGWAQVRNSYGASVENTWEKLQYDLYYIKNMSIFFDLLILLHTVQIVLFTRGSGEWTSKKRPSTTSVSYAG
jgi:exopolysaccharide biosynthesis polyprenyl glycosylphosphotransferase